MLFKLNKKTIIFSILILIIIIVIFQFFNNEKDSPYETIKVEKGNLIQTVDVSGRIKSSQDLSLHFETIGRIARIYVKEGDEVRAGQLLANLSLTELDSAINQSEATLNQKIAGPTLEQINIAQKQIDSAQLALNQAQKTLEDTIDLSRKTLNSKYVYAQSILDDSYIKIYNAYNVASTIQRSYFSGNTQESLKVKAELRYNIEEPMNDIKTYIDKAKSTNKEEDIELAVSKMTTTLSQILNSLTIIREISGNSSYDLIITLNDKNNLDLQKSYISASQTTFSSLESEINILKIQIEKNIFQAEAGVATAQAGLDLQKANYDSLIAPPRDIDIAYYRAVLDQAKANRNKAMIYAPISGVIVNVNKKQGESISTAETMIKMLSPYYEIDVDVPEIDVVKISLNDNAEITLDALGRDVKFSGKVINIDPASTDIQGVVYYKVRVAFNENSDDRVKPGMTANIIINTDLKENSLYLPFRAVLLKNGGQRYVRVLEDNKIVEKDVMLGIRGDDGLVEIISGVEEGEEVVLRILR